MCQVVSQSIGDLGQHHGFPSAEVAFDDMFACFSDKPEVEAEVMEAGDHGAEDRKSVV